LRNDRISFFEVKYAPSIIPERVEMYERTIYNNRVETEARKLEFVGSIERM
jgi:hypothetical protein